ncbi:class I SAM-dependent methyltransferase [Bacillus tianshenii]|nr:class I SAM-dependent methyltransferase [Bacillus tianshenii]
MSQIATSFNAHAKQYDAERRKLIPCYDEFYGTAAQLVDFEMKKPQILDLGAGTGLLSSMLLEKYPDGEFTLVDLSEEMLQVAKKRFTEKSNVTYVTADYTNYPFEGPYDAVVSSLSIHHLSAQQKEKLYQTINKLLKPGGIFVNADQALGETAELDALYKQNWKTRIEATDLTAEQLQKAYERTKLDKMSTLSEQLGWLKKADFKDVDCVFKSYSFIVLYGKKKS